MPFRLKYFYTALVLFFVAVSFAFAQEDEKNIFLPKSFRNLSLKMSLDDLKSGLSSDDYFNFQGERDVSFLPGRSENLVESAGTNFISRAFFQLRDEKVFIITLNLNTSLIDHYSVYQSFVRKYGEPVTLNPAKALWEDDEVLLSIERPLSIKYIDKEVYTEILDTARTSKSNEIFLREQFLNEF